MNNHLSLSLQQMRSFVRSRHKELAAAPPPLPAVREEEDEVFVVEFGETELHRQAAIKGFLPNSSIKMISNNPISDADLSKLLQENYHSIASRNTEGKTPRDVALDAELQENVDQIGKSPCLTLHPEKNSLLQITTVFNCCKMATPKPLLI